MRLAYDPALRYRFVFGFTFHDLDADTTTETTKLFFFENLTEEQHDLIRGMDEIPGREDLLLEFTDDVEADYGVHDYSTSGSEEMHGFSSYEVDADKADELMEKWRQFFITEGIACSPIQTMTWDEYEKEFADAR